ncbi:MAG: hypothetical protein EPN26_00365 [Rhodospirillales bacterium]|nr:MAG: hypothetical protein EPN26_00365 [Rhodospirillales bacterium]
MILTVLPAQDRLTPSRPSDAELNVNRSLKQIDRADSRLQSKPENGFDFRRPALEGRLIVPHLGALHCALGRNGISTNKREGDGTTPAGVFPLRQVFYRPDRIETVRTRMTLWPLTPADGWCDDPESADYNRAIHLPFNARFEKMWREDGLYDLGCVLGYNDDPVVPGLGSAIFLHVASPGFTPTEGCVALTFDHLRLLLERLGPGDAMEIQTA